MRVQVGDRLTPRPGALACEAVGLHDGDGRVRMRIHPPSWSVLGIIVVRIVT